MAGTTGLEPATSAVTGQRSNQLNYVPGLNRNRRKDGETNFGFTMIARNFNRWQGMAASVAELLGLALNPPSLI
jgi:hypothetical protein